MSPLQHDNWPACAGLSPLARECRLVDAYSTPTLLRLLASHHIDAGRFVTHRFALDEFGTAYDVFARPAGTGALKVVLSRTA